VKPVLGLLAAPFLFAACGGASQGVQLERQDGSAIEISNHVRAWCGAEDPHDAAAGQPRALHIVLGNFPPRPPNPQSYLFVSRRLSELAGSHVFKLDDDTDIAMVFVFDRRTRNEVASNLNGATGTVRFRDVSCTPGGKVTVSLDTVLVSENGAAGPVRVRGDLRARVDRK
jgi:hypothetical protein